MSNPNEERWNRAAAFTAYVNHLDCGDNADGRAKLAELRRMLLERSGVFRLYIILGDVLPEGISSREEDRYFNVAVLMALHKQRLRPGMSIPGFPQAEKGHRRRSDSFGASVGWLRQELSRRSKEGVKSLDLRFGALLNSPEEDLFYHLRQMVQRIADPNLSSPVPVNYTRLLYDLYRWDFSDSETSVQREWARHYWQSGSKEPEAAA